MTSAANEAELPDLAERLKECGVRGFRVTTRTRTLSPFEQLLANVAADEAAAAEHRNQLGVDHGTATSGSRARVDKAAASVGRPPVSTQ